MQFRSTSRDSKRQNPGKIFVTGDEKGRVSGIALQRRLEEACRSLVYVSETDNEIVPVYENGCGSIEEFVAQEARDEPIESGSVGDFFRKLIEFREWHTESDRERVRRFRKVQRMITENLSDAKLFRIGRVRLEILVLGHDAEGNIAGIRTRAVET